MQTSYITERLSLSLISVEDQAFVQELVNTEGWLEFIGDRNVHTAEDSVRYINKILSTPDLYYWVARISSSGTPIGIISFMKRRYLDHFDIGFALLPGFNGQGFAYEAAGAILEAARQDGGHERILATTLPHNTRSIGLLRKLGLQFERAHTEEGMLLHVYSLVLQ